jgi:hypothetical protein
MVFASAVLMLAGSPQTFLGIASAQESLFPVVEILAVYGRHASNELGQTLNFAASRQVHQTNDAKLGNGFCRYSITRWAAYRVLAELERFWLFEWAR